VGGLSDTVKPMVVFLKYFMSEEENYGILKSFIQQVDPEYPQGSQKMSYIAYFYLPKFLVKHVFGNMMKASCHLVNLLFIERRLIQKARLCTDNQLLAKDIDGLWPKLCPNARKWAGSLPKLPASGTLNAADVGIAQYGPANNKFMFLVYQTVFVDAVATIVKYGWNPCLDRTKWEKLRQGNNKLLELYLR
jgi:hypothetical protein